MAPTEGFEGDEFSNYLFSDLAPLLTLFGEQVTKQFLTMSMGWADNVLLAMGPLGIITIIVSAIRVGGGKNLKALIGRARESRTVAEQELLSSTSEDVCELWNGQEIVRLIGPPEGLSTLIVGEDGTVFDFLDPEDSDNESMIDIEHNSGPAPMDQTRLYSRAPNLALNIAGATMSSRSLWLWAAVGLLLQMFAIAFPGITTYHLKWDKAGIPVADYGYPCFILGTMCLTIGMLASGHVIEGATTESEAWLNTPGPFKNPRFFMLQQKRSVGDQRFPFCIILPAQNDGLQVLKMSSLNNNDYRTLATLSTAFAIVGYVIQFVGLRALHWSATIVQLGVTVVMTAIRAWVRRSLALNPKSSSDWEGHEEAWLALFLDSERKKKDEMRCDPNASDTSSASSGASPEASPEANSAPNGSTQHSRNYWSETLQGFTKQFIFGSGKSEKSKGSDIGFDEHSFFWEVICAYSYTGTSRITSENIKRGLFGPINGALEAELLFESVEKAQCQRRSSAQRQENSSMGRDNSSVERYSHSEEGYTDSDDEGYVDSDESDSTTDDISDDDDSDYEYDLELTCPLICSRITKSISRQHDENKLTPISEALCTAMERTLDKLSQGDAVVWKSNSIGEHLNQPAQRDEPRLVLKFNASNGHIRDFHLPDRTQERLCIEFRGIQRSAGEGSDSGKLLQWKIRSPGRDLIQAALALSLYSHEVRLATLNGQKPHKYVPPESRYSTRHRRIIGYTRDNGDSSSHFSLDEITRWLPQETEKEHRSALFWGNPQASDPNWMNMHFGMFLSSLSDANFEESMSDHFCEIVIDSYEWDKNAASIYAEEIFSVFMLGVASQIVKVNGETTTGHTTNRGRNRSEICKNSVFRSIAKELVEQKLVDSITEANILIVPAFAKYGLLPTDAKERDVLHEDNSVHQQDPTHT